MTIKLIATDMDGTFLDGKGTYDKKRFDRLLNKLAEQEIWFVAASGRQLLALEAMFSAFTDRIIFVAENGGIVKYQDQILFEEKMPFEQVLEIAEFVRRSDFIEGDSVLLSGAKGSYILETADAYARQKAATYYENIQIVSDFSTVVDDILKLTVSFKPESVLEGEAWLNAQLIDARAVTTGLASIDIIPSGISKATGLSYLAEKFKIQPSEILAFGDNLNDLEMLAYAGTSFAMLNARDEVKAVADDVIGHHEEASVMTYLENLVK